MSRIDREHEDLISAAVSWCPICAGWVETPLGHADMWNHWLDEHRDVLLSTHGREVFSQPPRV